jgi:protocatechuate 3,4-dioxygenase beta subunit
MVSFAEDQGITPVTGQRRAIFSRRAVLKVSAATAAISAAGIAVGQRGFAQESSGATATAVSEETAATAASCLLTPELAEGPYYLDDALVRQDITESKEGLPLTLRITVVDPTACAPLSDVAVDIWHCDSHGYYSGIEGNNPGPDADPEAIEQASIQTFLRGVQITDANGFAEFQTIYPGWYISRTIHVHMKVIVDGETSTTYEDGHVAHTGQLFFDEAATAQVLQLEPYASRPNEQRTTNDEDNILGDHEDEEGFFLTLSPLTEGAIENGFLGEITIGVDPTATPAEADMGGPGAPQGGPRGPPPDQD